MSLRARSRSFAHIRPRPGDIGTRYRPVQASGLAGSAGDEGGDDVRGVPVMGLAGSVVAHRRPRVGVTGRLLHVPQGTPASRAAVMNE